MNKEYVAWGLVIIVLVTAAVAEAKYLNYRSEHPRHVYDAADLTRDTKTCQQLGFKIAPRVNHNRSGDRWIQGADCVSADGATIAVPSVNVAASGAEQ